MIDLASLNLGPVDDHYAPDVIVASAHPGNVRDVLIDGQLIRRDSQALKADVGAKALELATASRQRLLALV